ncbi:response regulator [Alteromonas sp. CYL-A6]|uniref:response regulator n=1 Tax=Alteromonas nitratireducens TaxID=3390813 RepID=UPI0034B6BE43
MQYRLAIVEDNANARTTLRSHMLPMGIFEVSSFATGAELRAALRKQHFELVLIDYHLGQGKTGAEWIRELRQSGLLKPSTGVIFITSDRMPQTIGRIIDVHPDILIIKPYTIASLSRHLDHYITYRNFVANVLRALDADDLQAALRIMMRLSDNPVPPRLQSDVLKLHARLLFESGDTENSAKMYDSVLVRSEKVLWAQWGKIQCQHAAGQWPVCRDTLHALVSNDLARDRAYEWLASMAFEEEAFSQTERFLDNIRFSELSVPATRMKTLAYQRQDRTLDAIDLLQKKRAMHRSAKDRFNEFTFELAEFYLRIAEENPTVNRSESLSQARRMIGVAGRNQSDPQLIQKRDYLLAFSAVLEDDLDKARQLIEDTDSARRLERADPATLAIAAKVHHATGDEETAKALLDIAQKKNAGAITISEQVLNQSVIKESEKNIGIAADKALTLNEEGTALFVIKDYINAMQRFYDAFDMADNTAAFGLNLLHCMVESLTPTYRRYTVFSLRDLLSQKPMSDNNRQRLNRLTQVINANADALTAEEPDYSSEPVPSETETSAADESAG